MSRHGPARRVSEASQAPRAGALAGLGRSRRGDVRRRPGRLTAVGFASLIAAGTALLLLPAATSGEQRATFAQALFTSTSAVCVTGLIAVDTPTFWSPFGQAVILALIQLGGLGILVTASLFGLLISRRMGLHTRLLAAAETRTIDLGDVRRAVVGVIVVSAVVEMGVAAVLAGRLWLTYDEPFGRAVWLGVFHGVSAFNNAGFALYSDSLMGFVVDPWVSLPVALAVIIGGLGFPVITELLRRNHRPARWSLHTKITLVMTGLLLVGGTAFVTLNEWNNPGTLGPLDTPGKYLAGFFQGVMPRTAGFNSVDVAAMGAGTWFATDLLMFIGGGAAGTAGGIKVTTAAVLAMVVVSELRGDPDVTIFDRRVLPFGQRQALSVAFLGLTAIVAATLALDIGGRFPLDQVLYEVISAYSLVGLSTGITAELYPWQQMVLAALMFIGRLGPVTLASALALRERQPVLRYPASLPIMG